MSVLSIIKSYPASNFNVYCNQKVDNQNKFVYATSSVHTKQETLSLFHAYTWYHYYCCEWISFLLLLFFWPLFLGMWVNSIIYVISKPNFPSHINGVHSLTHFLLLVEVFMFPCSCPISPFPFCFISLISILYFYYSKSLFYPSEILSVLHLCGSIVHVILNFGAF